MLTNKKGLLRTFTRFAGEVVSDLSADSSHAVCATCHDTQSGITRHNSESGSNGFGKTGSNMKEHIAVLCSGIQGRQCYQWEGKEACVNPIFFILFEFRMCEEMICLFILFYKCTKLFRYRKMRIEIYNVTLNER